MTGLQRLQSRHFGALYSIVQAIQKALGFFRHLRQATSLETVPSVLLAFGAELRTGSVKLLYHNNIHVGYCYRI